MGEFMAIFWSILVLSIVVKIYSDFVMKIQVNERLPEEQRFSWWTRNSWKVARKYRELYPDSYLPLIGQCSFWLCLALGTTVLVNSLGKSN